MKPLLWKYALIQLLSTACIALSLHAQDDRSKIGGICFRVDDDQSKDKVLQFAGVFNKYGYNFSLALNLAIIAYDDQYISLIKELQLAGHEFMDHTPDHRTNYFTVGDTIPFSGLPGVDHISGSKVCLRIGSIDTSKKYPGEGFADLRDDTLFSRSAGAFSQLAADLPDFIGVYLPTLGLLCNVTNPRATNLTDPDTLQLLNFWGEEVHLGNRTNIPFQIIGVYDVTLTNDALILLGRRTLSLCDQIGIRRPYTWIEPGGSWPSISSSAIAGTFGASLGYRAGGCYLQTSLKCYNGYDPAKTARYGMDWGNFFDDIYDTKKDKAIIADEIARHFFLVGHSHFDNLLGGWDGYLARVDSLLAWSQKNKSKINVVTYQQMAKLLYDTPQNPYVNIMPALNVDLDENGIPDGYYDSPGYTDGHLNSTGGVAESGGYSYSISNRGSICYVRELAGLEKGENDFSIWTKGGNGDSVVVKFGLGGYASQLFKFPATDTVWRRYSLAQSKSGITKLIVPPDASTMDVQISCSDYASGTVGVSGMVLSLKLGVPLKIVSFPDTIAYAGETYSYSVHTAYQNDADTLTYRLAGGPAWLSVDPTGWLHGSPLQADTGIAQVQLRVSDQHGNSDVQVFLLNVRIDQRYRPTILSVPDTAVCPGGLYQYSPSVTNPFHDTLTYELTKSPSWLSVDKNGSVQGRAPWVNGTFPVRVVVRNKTGDEASQEYSLTVAQITVDSFEYSESPLIHGWTVEEGLGTAQTEVDTVLHSRVMVVQTNQSTNFRIDLNGAWAAQSFSMKFQSSSDFTLYVRGLDSLGKLVTFEYLPDAGSATWSGGYATFHLGQGYRNGNWNIIARDLRADLSQLGLANQLKVITAFMVRGSFRMDDLTVGNIVNNFVTDSADNSKIIADRFQLDRNYPNPFNPSTIIKYSVLYPSTIRLEVYNILGQRVKTLVADEYKPNGFYSVSWDGQDEHNVKAASGIYFYRLVASPTAGVAPYVATSKMILLK